MASFPGPSSGPASDAFEKLSADPNELRREAEQAEDFKKSQDEATQRRLANLIQDQQAMPLSVNEVRVHGATNLRRGFLDPLIKPLVEESPGRPSTLGEVKDRLQDLSNKLNGLQIFRAPPEIFLTSPNQTDASSTPTDIDVDLRLREHSRIKLQTGTDVGNGEGSAYGSLLWRNIIGGAETLEVNAKAGTRTRSAYSTSLAAPVASNPNIRLSLEGMATAADKPWASHEEVVKGGAAKVSWVAPETGDRQTLEYAGSWRQVTGLGSGASMTVRGDAGDSVKSALKHTFLRERRNNPQLPQDGYMVRSSWELAGVGPLAGDVAFSKGEIELGGAVPLSLSGAKHDQPSGVSIGGGLRLGMLYPLPLGFGSGSKTLPSRINDRFQLGGPTDVRGFKLGGIGPHDGQDSVGGDLFAAGSVNVLAPLPYRDPSSNLRLQLFANGGRLVAMRNTLDNLHATGDSGGLGAVGKGGLSARNVADGMVGAVADLLGGKPSMAAGVGLVYAHPVARFELNFSLPLLLRKGEVGTKGLQVGVGINFL